MREHKYRAWDTVKKVMYSANELGQDQETLSADGRGFVNVSGTSTRLSQFHTHLLPLEYTGLRDKNGKEVYEGDMVYWKHVDDKGIVYYNEKEVCYCAKPFEKIDKDTNTKNSESWLDNTHMEVIGNIHEGVKDE